MYAYSGLHNKICGIATVAKYAETDICIHISMYVCNCACNGVMLWARESLCRQSQSAFCQVQGFCWIGKKYIFSYVHISTPAQAYTYTSCKCSQIYKCIICSTFMHITPIMTCQKGGRLSCKHTKKKLCNSCLFLLCLHHFHLFQPDSYTHIYHTYVCMYWIENYNEVITTIGKWKYVTITTINNMRCNFRNMKTYRYIHIYVIHIT